MKAACFALIVLAAWVTSSLATPVDRCATMRCANGPCVNGKCTGKPKRDAEVKCGENMHYEGGCGSSCPARCDLDPAQSSCFMECRTGCFCNEGFIFEKVGGKCIRQADCPKQIGKREGNTESKCALLCKAGQICKDGKCVRNPICPLFNLREPKPGCDFVMIINSMGCPASKERCTAA